MKGSILQFKDPVEGGGSCNVCVSSYSPDPVTVLEIGTTQSTVLTRLCARHLKVLREDVLEEYLKRVIIPNAPQRRLAGGIPERIEGDWMNSSLGAFGGGELT